ncbi:unnamed protein product [Adineta ricciae]|uniref:C3H1-type domain-containing protein n=1 Tax=Adineta ricciae TaxID=249248 RepID=A0A815K9F0_ADIRI|nr:unnamed protein product [Adineta ricciae]CAF1389978.1 unnamed protein product [Adineta ricciae]
MESNKTWITNGNQEDLVEMNIRIDNELFQQLKNHRIEQFKVKYPSKTFNHRIYRLLIKKLRRQFLRQRNAKERDDKLRCEEIQRENDPLHQAWIIHRENLRHQREIQEEQENEKARKAYEQREIQRKKLEEKQKTVSIPATTHNPLALYQVPSIERPPCAFYSKTGVCRYGERCRRAHPKADITNTLLAVNMYSNFEMQYGLDEEYDLDIGLEFEESERYENFKDFYYDVLPEFERFGQVITFKVCSNSEIHLRGNVYIQYETDYQAMLAYRALNTRYYAGRMIQCQFVNIPSWSTAICGLSELGKCPKGRRCNYLHVFRNPSLKSNRSRSEDHSTKKKKRRHHS